MTTARADRSPTAQRTPLSALVFAALGAGLLLLAAGLAILGSFAYPAALSVGLLFLAAALLSRSISSPRYRVAAVLLLVGTAMLVYGSVATPIFYAGWGALAASAAVAIGGALRRR